VQVLPTTNYDENNVNRVKLTYSISDH